MTAQQTYLSIFRSDACVLLIPRSTTEFDHVFMLQLGIMVALDKPIIGIDDPCDLFWHMKSAARDRYVEYHDDPDVVSDSICDVLLEIKGLKPMDP